MSHCVLFFLFFSPTPPPPPQPHRLWNHNSDHNDLFLSTHVLQVPAWSAFSCELVYLHQMLSDKKAMLGGSVVTCHRSHRWEGWGPGL